MSVDETQYKASGIAEPSTTDGRCIHCRLDLPRGETSSFCCSGCAVAHEAIQSAGLGNTYYSLRKVISGATGVPARTGKLPELVKKQIGSKQFIEESTADLGDGYRRARLAIDGMTCAACSWLVKQVVTSQKGIGSATVDLPGSTLSFDFDENKTSLGFLADHLSRFGYDLHPLQDRPEGPSQQERVLLTKAGVSWALAGNVMLLAFALYSGLSMEGRPDVCRSRPLGEFSYRIGLRSLRWQCVFQKGVAVVKTSRGYFVVGTPPHRYTNLTRNSSRLLLLRVGNHFGPRRGVV